MDNGSALLITIVAAVFFGLLAQILAHRWHIPAIVFLLIFGIALGNDALGLVHPDELGSGLGDMGNQKALIVGANGLGCAVASLLNKYDGPALLIDTNHTSVERARQKGINAAPGNALEEQVLEELHAEEYETFLAVTSNSEVNVLACQLARVSFAIERAFPALGNPAKGANPTLLKQTGGKLAFGRFIDVSNWEKPGTEIYELSWQFPPDRPGINARDLTLGEDLIPVMRIRNGSAGIVHAEQAWQPADTIVFLSLQAPEAAQSALDQM